MVAIDGGTVAGRLASLGAVYRVSGPSAGFAVYRLAHERGAVLSLHYGGRVAWFEFNPDEADRTHPLTRAEEHGRAFMRCHQLWNMHQERARLLAAGYALIGGW